MMKKLWVSFGLIVAALLLVPEGFADAKSDCQIQYEKSGDGSCNLVYVKNTNEGKRVIVTISVSETSSGKSRRLPDRVIRLNAAERSSLGGDKSGDATYTFSVLGASYGD